ncbi:MAG: hypothetical protein WBW84_18595 [Acidobacteriaceae bacterium]
MKIADLVADQLGQSNRLTRAQAIDQARSRVEQREDYLAGALAEGTHVSLTVPQGAAENATESRAVISANGENINRALIEQGYGAFRPSWAEPKSRPCTAASAG